MEKHLAANALTLLIVGLVAAAIALNWAKGQYQGPGPLTQAVCVKVPSGGKFYDVSKDLESMGAISSGAIFRAGAAYEDRDHLLKAGSYLVEPGSSMAEIVQQVTTAGRSTCGSEMNFRIGIARAQVDLRTFDAESGTLGVSTSFVPGEDETPAEYTAALSDPDMRFRVTLAEGVTSWQVVDELKLAGFLEGEVDKVPPEGMLAPDSYEVTPGMARADLLAQMTERQEAILAAAWAGRDEGLPLASAEELLILASIIEKETGVADERRTISQVFVNRLRQGMRLQTDPTVIYGVTLGEKPLGRGLRQSELQRKTPWNTYEIDGLPATPIANPGRASIEAAAHPDGSKYLFFVADGSGGHAFAETLAEHNRNVAKWRAIEAQQSDN